MLEIFNKPPTSTVYNFNLALNKPATLEDRDHICTHYLEELSDFINYIRTHNLAVNLIIKFNAPVGRENQPTPNREIEDDADYSGDRIKLPSNEECWITLELARKIRELMSTGTLLSFSLQDAPQHAMTLIFNPDETQDSELKQQDLAQFIKDNPQLNELSFEGTEIPAWMGFLNRTDGFVPTRGLKTTINNINLSRTNLACTVHFIKLTGLLLGFGRHGELRNIAVPQDEMNTHRYNGEISQYFRAAPHNFTYYAPPAPGIMPNHTPQ